MFSNKELIDAQKVNKTEEYEVDEQGFAVIKDSINPDSRSLLDDSQFRSNDTDEVNDVNEANAVVNEFSTLEDVTNKAEDTSKDNACKTVEQQLREIVMSNDVTYLIESGKYHDAKILGKLQLLYLESLGV